MKPSGPTAIKAAIQRTLHPPLPLDRRQSQRLVNLISASFRQKLEEEDPRMPGSRRPVEAHLQSVLSNPLFQQPPVRASAADSARGAGPGPSVSPATRFTHHVALGTATTQLAAAILGQPIFHQRVLDEQSREELQRCTVAILNWLWSSGLEESMAFVRDRACVRGLVNALVLTNRNDVLWRWLANLVIQSKQKSGDALLQSAAQNQKITDAKHLLNLFIQHKYQMAPSVDDCIREFYRVWEKSECLEEWRRKATKISSIQLTFELLRRFDSTALDAKLYEQVTTNPSLIKTMSPGVRACLALFAPNPDAKPALAILDQELTWLMSPPPDSSAWQHRILFALRTINVLLDQNDQENAARIVALMKKYYRRGYPQQAQPGIVSPSSDPVLSKWEDILFRQLSSFASTSG